MAAAGKKRGPLCEPTLGEFIALVAKFGGHLGRRGDKPPGAQALWQGLSRVRDFACAWQAIHHAQARGHPGARLRCRPALACPDVATIPRAGPARTPSRETISTADWILVASAHAA